MGLILETRETLLALFFMEEIVDLGTVTDGPGDVCHSTETGVEGSPC